MYIIILIEGVIITVLLLICVCQEHQTVYWWWVTSVHVLLLYICECEVTKKSRLTASAKAVNESEQSRLDMWC